MLRWVDDKLQPHEEFIGLYEVATIEVSSIVTHEITQLVKYFPRRQSIFNCLKDDISPGTVGVRVLCPTRWTVHADSMLSIIKNYRVLQDLWDKTSQVVHDSETVARIGGISAHMKLFYFYFGLVLGELLLRHTDNLSKSLQKKKTSACEGQQTAEKTRKTLMGIRNDENFDLFWKKVNRMISDVEVSESVLPRKRTVPRRYYEDGDAPPTYDMSPKDMYRRVYFEALDLLVQAIHIQ